MAALSPGRVARLRDECRSLTEQLSAKTEEWRTVTEQVIELRVSCLDVRCACVYACMCASV